MFENLSGPSDAAVMPDVLKAFPGCDDLLTKQKGMCQLRDSLALVDSTFDSLVMVIVL
jgi:hypothetical protein